VVGKKQERKTRKIILHFLMKYDLNFAYGFFPPPSGSFWVRLLPELLTGSYDLEISDNEIMICSGIENF